MSTELSVIEVAKTFALEIISKKLVGDAESDYGMASDNDQIIINYDHNLLLHYPYTYIVFKKKKTTTWRQILIFSDKDCYNSDNFLHFHSSIHPNY